MGVRFGLEPLDRKWIWASLLLGLGVHLVCALNSAGFYQYDEHFSILEYVSHFRGNSSAALPWEFHREIRPWLQPVLYSTLQSLGAFDPFAAATAFRVFSCVLGFWATLLFCLAFLPAFATSLGKRLFVILATMLWFVPFIHARISAENLSGTAAIAGISLMQLGLNRGGLSRLQQAGTGFFFGLAFALRIQTLPLMLGALLWLYVVARQPLRSALFLLLGALSALGLSLAADRIGYGHFVFSQYDYFRVNILEGVAFQFNPHPWWEYLSRSVTYLPPLSTGLLVAAGMGLWVLKKNLIAWAVLPFLLVHFAISNKELRFLFPVLPLLTLPMALAIERFVFPRWSLAWKVLAIVLGIQNLAMLMAVCLSPASSGIGMYRYLYRQVESPVTLYSIQGDPFGVLDLKLKYYEPPGYRFVQLASLEQMEAELQHERSGRWLYIQALEIPPERQLLSEHCEERYRTFPRWFKWINWTNWLARSRPWNLFYCQGAASPS